MNFVLPLSLNNTVTSLFSFYSWEETRSIHFLTAVILFHLNFEDQGRVKFAPLNS